MKLREIRAKKARDKTKIRDKRPIKIIKTIRERQGELKKSTINSW